MERQKSQTLWTLIDPLVAHQGYELVEVEVHGNRNAVVRVFIDGKSGVTIDKCAEFSRQISDMLDVEDLFKSAYTLEVSSPGMDRPLRQAKHFSAVIGKTVAFKIEAAGGKVEKTRGRLSAVSADSVTFEESKERSRTVKLADVVAAHLVYDWNMSQAKTNRASGK